ncbi:hypothetical protein BYT27DRAFT_7101987 [Phlegmacium glaucopus]|nr:hypothetical protein BYT27DRAFT_7101987 [Phlegmacium glaucopus]
MKSKLNLKRTPEEELQHRLRKERKRAKRRHSSHGDFKPQAGTSLKRSHADEYAGPSRKWTSSDDDDQAEYGPQPANFDIPNDSKSHAQKPDYDALKAEIEQEMFRHKMFDAMGDDERLDSIEAQFNDFAQVPDRWRTSGTGKSKANIFEEDGYAKMDPRYMDDEEYAEWIRVGMYRKTHAEEYAEQERKKAAKAARREDEKARKAERARLEKAAEEERKRKELERESRRWDYAREEYGIRWRALLSTTGDSEPSRTLSFDDIPWPVAVSCQKSKKRQSGVPRRSITVEDLTADAITAFLLPAGQEDKEKRKEKLRESILRFHPDKFEGRFMKFVKESEKEKMKEAIGQVSRVLNSLM